MKGDRIEAIGLPPKHKLAIPQTYRPEVADALSGGEVGQDGILLLGGHPHSAGRTVLLEVDLIGGPEINHGFLEKPAEFFYIPSDAPDPHGQ